MRRRELIVLLGAAASWPAGAQETPRRARIAFVVTGEAFPRRYFDQAMQQLGWIEGRNLIVERHVTGEDPQRRNAVAAELVTANPDVIVVAGTVDARPVHALTRTIPIVVISGSDLVEAGLAQSLAHPGGNVTGISRSGGELDGKRIQLLRELIPRATRISVLCMARDPRSTPRATAITAIARPLGLQVVTRSVSQPKEMDVAYAASASDHDQAILVMESPLMFENQQRLVALALQYRLPAIYERREFVEGGGLLSYGQVFRENSERAASLTDKILNGANPADLPVEQPAKFELVINLKTAQALGLTVPSVLLARADEVIE